MDNDNAMFEVIIDVVKASISFPSYLTAFLILEIWRG